MEITKIVELVKDSFDAEIMASVNENFGSPYAEIDGFPGFIKSLTTALTEEHVKETTPERVFVQHCPKNSPGKQWSDLEVVDHIFASRQAAISWARESCKMNHGYYRLTFPGMYWEPQNGDTVQDYAGRLSGTYINP